MIEQSQLTPSQRELATAIFGRIGKAEAKVHGTTIVDARAIRRGDEPPTGDASLSPDGGAVLGILTADCLPVLLCSTVRPGFAAVHCGWRSLSAGIVAEAVEALGGDAADLIAWLGPAISQPAFEVGDDVRDVFLAGVEDAGRCFRRNDGGRWQADLCALARLCLAAAGVTRVYGGGLCTFADESRFYSYRRDGTTGRMASLVWARQHT